MELRRVLGPESLVQHPTWRGAQGRSWEGLLGRRPDFKLWCRKLRAAVENEVSVAWYFSSRNYKVTL